MSASQEGATLKGTSFPLHPTRIHVSDEHLSDLRTRLQRARWPLGTGNDDWYYGVGRAYLEELVDYWLSAYDWRKAEAAINRYEQYQVNVEGVCVLLGGTRSSKVYRSVSLHAISRRSAE